MKRLTEKQKGYTDYYFNVIDFLVRSNGYDNDYYVLSLITKIRMYSELVEKMLLSDGADISASRREELEYMTSRLRKTLERDIPQWDPAV